MAEEKHNQDNKLNEIVNLSKVKALVEFAKMHIDNSSSLLENHKKSLDELIKRNQSTNTTTKSSGKGLNSLALQEQKQKLKQIYPSLYPVLNEAQFALNEANLLVKEDIKSLINETIKANETAIAAIDSSIQVKDPSNTATETAISVNVTSSKANDVLNALNASFSDATKSNNEKMKNSIALAIKLGKMQANNTVVANPLVIITKDKNNKPDYKIYTKPAEIISQQTQASKNTNKTQLRLYKCMNGSFHKVRPVANGAAAIAAEHRYENVAATTFTNAVTISTGAKPAAADAKAATNTDALAAANTSAANVPAANAAASVSNLLPNMANLNKIAAANAAKAANAAAANAAAASSNVSNLLPNMANLNKIAVANAAKAANAAAAFPAPANKKGLAVIPNSSQPRESNITQANLNGGRRKTHRNKKSKSQRKRKHTRKH